MELKTICVIALGLITSNVLCGGRWVYYQLAPIPTAQERQREQKKQNEVFR
ncbi:hypothetical protein QR685DRAFT_552789 [Neurospora intermedia]|uniref:Uncharacterized protein n=1 Tax=Neurospora intermedia TaxID=5142 RepID=A0ABR3DJ42_NEUIN